jgi:hypothetical protein
MLGRRFVLVAMGLTLTAVGAANAQQSQQAEPKEKPERRICRMMDRPGSLAGSRRVCLTRAEWELAATEQQRVGQQILRNLDSCSARSEGGTMVGGGPGQATQAEMQRMMGC